MTDEQEVEQSFAESLNRHGYGFQYAVVKSALDLYPHQSDWLVEATEFPVEVQGQGTRIDILLRHSQKPFYIAAECKRANPALADWCFAPASFVHRTGADKQAIFEHIQGNLQDPSDTTSVFSMPKSIYIADPPSYHIALEVKRRKEKGDPQGSPRGAIEEAATQVLRGVNGMVTFFAKNRRLVTSEGIAITLLPAIFTTAMIWASNANLGTADLKTGKVDLTSYKFAQRDWLLYQYHMSPGLKHSHSRTDDIGDYPDLGVLGRFMEHEYIRTIPVVSPSGIPQFLEWAGELVL